MHSNVANKKKHDTVSLILSLQLLRHFKLHFLPYIQRLTLEQPWDAHLSPGTMPFPTGLSLRGSSALVLGAGCPEPSE